MIKKELDIKVITKSFGENYKLAKISDIAKESDKKLFFQAATQELEKQRLPRKTVLYDGPGNEVKDWIKTYHPGWRLHTYSGENMVIERDPAMMKFTYVNPDDKMVYARTVVELGPMLDKEHLQKENPALWDEITEWPSVYYGLVFNAVHDVSKWTTYKVHNYTVDILTKEGYVKVIKDPSTWTQEQAAAIQPYMIPGPISVKLVPPRPATDEELDT